MSAPSPPATPPDPLAPPPRPRGLRGFLTGPRLVDHKGAWFLVIIFVLILVVFSVTFYEFTVTLRPLPTAPVTFSAGYMLDHNGTFNVTSVSNTSWPFQNFTVNLTLNNFGFYAQPLAPSGENATFLIGTATNKGVYHVIWINHARNGLVGVGDVFWVTGDGVGLPGLSYIKVSLIWNGGLWHADEYFVTSETIV